MIAVKIDGPNGVINVECRGNPADLATETAMLAGIVYERVKVANPEVAELYRNMVGVMLQPDSPAWDPPDGGEGHVMVIPNPKRDN